jgi:hypothetical protein
MEYYAYITQHLVYVGVCVYVYHTHTLYLAFSLGIITLRVIHVYYVAIVHLFLLKENIPLSASNTTCLFPHWTFGLNVAWSCYK